MEMCVACTQKLLLKAVRVVRAVKEGEAEVTTENESSG